MDKMFNCDQCETHFANKATLKVLYNQNKNTCNLQNLELLKKVCGGVIVLGSGMFDYSVYSRSIVNLIARWIN